jgi:hypothetical protein
VITFERYKAWERAHELALSVYDASDRWPYPERFELTTQLRRAVLSIPANLAEGLAYLLRFARDRKLLSPEEWLRLDEIRNEVGRLTWGLLRAARLRA